MKRQFTISILFFAFAAKAQLVTITETHQLPVIGDTVHYVDANTFGFDPIGVGPVTAKVWDESGLLNTGTTKDFFYVDPVTIPLVLGRDSFPNATIARGESGVNGYFYYQNTANDINRLGWYLDTTNFGIYKNGTAANEFHFPVTAGQTITSAYHGNYAPFNVGEDSVRIENGSVSINADMQGQMILPAGTFNDVLRLHVLENFHISAYYSGIPISDILISDDYYYWFADTILQPIILYGTTSNDGTVQATVLRYQPISTPTGITNTEIINSNIFPNPTNGIFTIENNDFFLSDYNLEIYNVQGEKIYSSKLKKEKLNKVDISDSQKGIYLLKIFSDEKILTEKILIN